MFELKIILELFGIFQQFAEECVNFLKIPSLQRDFALVRSCDVNSNSYCALALPHFFLSMGQGYVLGRLDGVGSSQKGTQ